MLFQTTTSATSGIYCIGDFIHTFFFKNKCEKGLVYLPLHKKGSKS